MISNNPRNTIKKSNIGFLSALERVFLEFPERPKGIISGRYGIKNGDPKTLEEIGREYDITRERVRQIIKETLKKLKKGKSDVIEEIKNKLAFTIKEKSGIIKEEELMAQTADLKERGALKFFLDLFDNIEYREILGEVEGSWSNGEFSLNEWRKTKNLIKEILEKKQRPLTDQELVKEILNLKSTEIEPKKLFNYLDVSSEIKKGRFQKWGLKSWDEITPKGTREKIYLILKETGRPMHFKEIAEAIDKYKLNKKKRTHPQTVHNELIRDKRFILVGRGTYALSEWGFEKGTVREVIEDILKKNSRPMRKEDILEQALKMRKVKKSTVMINLNNFFQKVGKNEYSVKK
ncbi:MAG: HTH domain-containing protein [Patescibacteria group bacterium]